MILLPNALVTVEYASEALNITAPADKLLLVDQINRASAVIDIHCHHVLRRGLRREIREGGNGTSMWLRNRPIISIQSVNIDSARAFGTSTIIDPTAYTFDERGVLYYETGFGYDPIEVKLEAGYDLVVYEKPVTPTTGLIYSNGSSLEIYDGTKWNAYTGLEIPQHVRHACLETILFIRRRTNARESGMVSKDKVFSDGATVNYEITLPRNVQELLGPEVSHV
jgi:hypothetical protein